MLKTQIMTSQTKQTMYNVASKIWQSDGLRGFWAGVIPNMSRTFLVNAAELGTYDQSKEILKPIVGDNFIAFLGASTIAGLASAATSTPADVVKTRLMNDAGQLKTRASMIGALLAIGRTEGLSALYQGFIPIVTRKIIWCSSFFLLYEHVRAWLLIN